MKQELDFFVHDEIVNQSPYILYLAMFVWNVSNIQSMNSTTCTWSKSLPYF